VVNAGLDTYCDWSNTGLSLKSAGGPQYPVAQFINDNNGFTRFLGVPGSVPDTSGNGKFIFKLKCFIGNSPLTYGCTKENVGVVYMNYQPPVSDSSSAISYLYDQQYSIAFNNDNFCMLPDGITVPTLFLTSNGPVQYHENTNPLDAQSIAWQYIFQKTRAYKGTLSLGSTQESALSKSLVYYIGKGHNDWIGVDVSVNSSFPVASCETTPYMNYPLVFPGGWDWPVASAFQGLLYPDANAAINGSNGIPTLMTQYLRSDLYRMQVYAMWLISNQCIDRVALNDGVYEVQGVHLGHIIDFANSGGSGKVDYIPLQLASYMNMEGLYHFVGPHKIETLRDTSANRNHLSIDFGKAVLFENNNNQLEITPRPGYNAQILIDGSGASISLNGVTLTTAKLSALLALVP